MDDEIIKKRRTAESIAIVQEKPKGDKQRPEPRITAELLNADDHDRLKEQAKLQVHLEAKAAAEKQALAKYVRLERGAVYDGEELISVLIDLPGHANQIRLDYTIYHHGQWYHEIPVSIVRTLNEVMWRAWRHEREVGGINDGAYRSPQNTTLSPHSGVSTSRHLRA